MIDESEKWKEADFTGTKGAYILQYLAKYKHPRSTQEIADWCACTPNTARKWLYRLLKANKVSVREKYYYRGIYLLLWSAI